MTSRTLKLSPMDSMKINLQFAFKVPSHSLNPTLLKSSLQHLIDTEYWPLLGIRNGLYVTENPNSSLLFEEQILDITLDSISHIPNNLEKVQCKLPLDTLFGVLLTRCIDGYIIGISVWHGLCDGYSVFNLLMTDWSTVYNGGEIDPICHNRDLFQTESDPLESQDELNHLVVPAFDGLSISVPSVDEFNCDIVRISAEKLEDYKQKHGKSRLLSLYKEILGLLPHMHEVQFPVNLRDNASRWSPVIPSRYMGNALVYAYGIDKEPENILATLTSERVQRIYATLYEMVPDDLTKMVIGGPITSLFLNGWLHFNIRPIFGDVQCELELKNSMWSENVILFADGPENSIDIVASKKYIETLQSLS